MDIQTAQFNIGDVVTHVDRDYRGVIIDVDANFQGDEVLLKEIASQMEKIETIDFEENKDPMSDNIEPSPVDKEQPWYMILIDEQDVAAYMPENQLLKETDPSEIFNPLLDTIFHHNQNGDYQILKQLN